MLEMLFSFSVFCLVASFLPLAFSILFQTHSIDVRIQKMEWELFVNQLKKEIQSGDDVEVVNGQLVIVDGEERITIQKYNDLLRRLVNMRGHEVVLQNVQSVHFEKNARSVTITVDDLYGYTHTATVFSFIDWDAGDG